jgi:hypothetical protein
LLAGGQPCLRTARRFVRPSIIGVRAAKERLAQRKAKRKKERPARKKGGNPEEEEKAVAAVARGARRRSAASLHKATAQGIAACILGVQLCAW